MRTKATKKRKQKCKGKQLYGYFQRRTGKIAHEKIWTWLRNWNLKRETESLLIAARNSAIKINYTCAKIERTLPNSKCRLYWERSETIINISKRSKLKESDYKIWHALVEKSSSQGIVQEIQIRFKFSFGICTNQNSSWRMTRILCDF